MIKVIFFIFLIFTSICVIGQPSEPQPTSIKEDFEHEEKIPEGWIISNTGCFIGGVTRPSGTGKYGIGLKENGYIISPDRSELLKGENIGKVAFWYSYAQSGDNYQIVIEYESEINGNREWYLLEKINQVYNPSLSTAQSNSFDRKDIVLKVNGAKKLKFSVEGKVANTLYLDDIEITAITNDQKTKINEENLIVKATDRLTKYIEDLEKKKEETKWKDYKGQLIREIDELKANYIKGFEKIREISDKLNTMITFEIFGLYVMKRVDTANPLKYEDFNSVTKFMKTYQDPVDEVSINEIDETINEETKSNQIIGEKSKIGTVAYTIANVITAGRFGNIVSGIKSIFRSIFKKGNPKIPKRYADNVLKDAAEKLKMLNTFFKILEMENLIIIQLRDSFKENQNRQNNFEKNVLLLKQLIPGALQSFK